MKTLWNSLKSLLVLSLLLGLVYPLIVYGLGQIFFREKANGSLVIHTNKLAGSRLIGQTFQAPGLFWSRPSATDYNPIPSGGSNLGPSSAKLDSMVQMRLEQFLKLNHLSENETVPAEMLFESASGLDPHISPRAAKLQVGRILRERGLSSAWEERLNHTIDSLTEVPQFGFLGQFRVNVLLLNLELIQKHEH